LVSRDARATASLAPVQAHAWRFPIITLLLLGCVALEYAQEKDDPSYETALISEVLRVTDPSDLVLDQKGDVIFRCRPTPYIMELITGDRLERGLLPERIQEDVIATRTCVAAARIPLFPTGTRRFLMENFIPIGHLLIAGRLLPPSGDGANHSGDFEIAIPARYALVSESGDLQGLVDGKPYTSPRELDAGRHTFSLPFKGPRAAVVWAKAVQRNFSPFDAGRLPP